MKSNIKLLMLGGMAAFTALNLAPNHAWAEGNAAAPAMYNVEEVIIQPIHFGDAKIAQTCSLLQDELGAALLKTLRDNGVPATSALEAKASAHPGAARASTWRQTFFP